MSEGGRQARRPKSRPETLRRRTAILKAATEVFGMKGYANASLSEIADRVGMTHAGVLHHFGSKENLLLETVRYRDVSDLDELGLSAIPAGKAAFDHLIETAFRNEERVGIVQAFVVLSSEAITDDHPTSGYFKKRYQNLRREMVESFEELCADEGVVDAEVIANASASILAVMDGLQYQWLLEPGIFELGPTTKYAVNAIVDAVLGSRVPAPEAEPDEPTGTADDVLD
ncbi:MAG TPA: TetR/AcrR family transcriptional regulator [Arachnia sp.]|nr:TetR/AcrR family transcriptional regulator [Arachnia sp.]